MIVKCDVTYCVHNKDGECDSDMRYLSISETYTSSGFHPVCSEFYEKDAEDD